MRHGRGGAPVVWSVRLAPANTHMRICLELGCVIESDVIDASCTLCSTTPNGLCERKACFTTVYCVCAWEQM